MSENYDLVILGGGMGGYVAAIRARQLGLKVAIVEANLLGGTCLHQGCIPTKTLLKSAEIYQSIINSHEFGITTSEPVIHFSAIQNRKKQVVDQLYQGLQYLIEQNGITIYHGFGRLMGPSIFSPMAGAISVEHEDKQENTILIGKSVIIATGTVAKELPNLPFDGQYILSSNQALAMEDLPESMTIIGGGVIGVEWASLLNSLGVKVNLIEAQGHLLTGFDQELAKTLKRSLIKKGIHVLTDTRVAEYEISDNDQVNLVLENKQNKQTLTTNKVLVAIGRRANINQIGLDNTAIETDSSGFIKVNSFFQTKESHIYAIGDCIGGQQLAHVAAHEGKLAVEHIAGKDDKLAIANFAPSCVYSQPEVAAVGITEQTAIDKNINYKVKKMPFSAIGKALVNGDTTGFVKMIIDKDTDDLLGVHLIGNQVTELISEAGLALLLNATASELGLSIHPHPSLSEAIQEIALAIDDQPVHSQ
ncbi:dihydrolipoyl dehydrogenase [Amphibacillus sp. MSJ-3]|uniref:dihydrolipoyl dehydrogenase n=1 Tax=Amphibacillus sp. MSJ-3 TaxID=2841505 RepID=UPI001C0ED42D|nr:dihydrolipoyl dehydrogenase [Amphibacillus sp. MSJ-3]MBU5594815.1 dihydrolipoyl dehydrogenase [Amphibacillus sp. MSJ-3]